jgi:hypothetical protein
MWIGVELLAMHRARKLLLASGVPRAARTIHLGGLRILGRARRFAGGNNGSDPSAIRVLACAPEFFPTLGGSEVTLHRVLAGLADQGHRPQVLVDRGSPGNVDGIDVTLSNGRDDARLFASCDVVLAQLASRHHAMRMAARFDRPFVQYVQIGNIPRRSSFGKPALTLFCSDAVRRQHPWLSPALVLHPPIAENDYLTSPGDAVTLINLNELKGGDLFFMLAEHLLDRRFLGVRGWGTQLVPDEPPPNVTIMGSQPDVRQVYSRTRVLIMPSRYESYGRVALEAAVSGIPTIAHPSAGAREALGDAALWADRNDLDAWIAHLKHLEDPDFYRHRSELARARFDALDPSGELDAFENALRSLVSR